MVKIVGRKIEVGHDEVSIYTDSGVFVHPKKIDPLRTATQIDPSQYVLVQEGEDASYALSAQQQLGGLKFLQMNTKALEMGLQLATVKDITAHHRNVNLALQGKGVLYDASGNLIEGYRLRDCGNAINNAWVYLNNAYEKGSGFLGLDVVSIIGLDAEGKPITKRQPLEECVVDCWADIQGSTNSQGYYTNKSPFQRFEKGRTVYARKPIANSVVRFDTTSFGANLYCFTGSSDPILQLGGFLRAEGTAQNLGAGK